MIAASGRLMVVGFGESTIVLAMVWRYCVCLRGKWLMVDANE